MLPINFVFFLLQQRTSTRSHVLRLVLVGLHEGLNEGKLLAFLLVMMVVGVLVCPICARNCKL